jgi:hypothetical protein
MKKIILVLVLVMMYGMASAQTKVIYTCPMHPEIRMSKPGNCPKCGMTLVKKTIKVAATRPAVKKPVVKPKPAAPVQRQQKPVRDKDPAPSNTNASEQSKVIYTCVMHPEVQQDKPGKCPKCGMTLVRKTVTTTALPAKDTSRQTKPPSQQQTNAAQQTSKVIYTCVMHPEVQQDKPGKCPKCGMTLVSEENDQGK